MPKNQTATSSHPIESIFQGSIIDDNGKEVVITKQMIQKACEDLEEESISIYNDEKFIDENLDSSDYS